MGENLTFAPALSPSAHRPAWAQVRLELAHSGSVSEKTTQFCLRPQFSLFQLYSMTWVGKSGSSFLDYLQFRREGQKVQFCIRWKLKLLTDFNKADGLILFEHLWLLWGVNELANVKVLAHINVIQVLAMIIVIIAIIIFNWLDYKRLWLVFSSFQHGSLLLTESYDCP